MDHGKIAIMATCVGDIWFTGNSEKGVDRMIRYHLGINLRATEESIVLDQARFAEGIVIEVMGSNNVRNVHTPLGPEMGLAATPEEEEPEESRFPYARIVGKSMFMADLTRPNISSIVSVNSVDAFHHHLCDTGGMGFIIPCVT